ncbi:glycoside hydrolase family 76 protein [Rarobacter faecitabidus]|uniref:Putative alpha-1,6-mannanase (GH76 family) n=1 Tax=Rarobacter faecitabidus TaxID=13243 RepID=A0A542ZUI9_RARFA|nr:glycosyl hydrolase [Rarobacter faecitabidus]TQL63981.1 putative alpha-1,6-mannanase (GH76 family) [Rarobacter faecitabidus]
MSNNRYTRAGAVLVAALMATGLGITAGASTAFAAVCNKKCDATDPAQAGTTRVADVKTTAGPTIQIVFDETNAMGFGTVESSQQGDTVWVDRSFDGGRSWEKLGTTTNPGLGGWRTQMYNVDDWGNTKVGAMRACGQRPGGGVACTQWTRATWNAGNRVDAAATAMMMYYNQSIKLFQTSYDSSFGPTWGGAISTSALIRAAKATNLPSYRYVISRTFDEYKNKTYGSGYSGFNNQYSDDTGWWAMVWIDAYDLTGDSRYLDAAKSGAAHMKTFATSTCGGGITWQKNSPGKVTISNTLYIQVNAALANRVGGSAANAYRAEAENTWNWLRQTALARSDNRYWDTLNVNTCQASTSTPPFTYHNGTVVSGLVELSRYYRNQGNITVADSFLNDAKVKANAITQVGGDFTDSNGFMKDPAEGWDNCTQSGAYFKAAAVRGLDEVDRQISARPYRPYLQANANKAYTSGARNKLDQYSLKWTSWTQGPGEGCQASALALLAAAW